MKNLIKIGSISASIGYDKKYTDYLTVVYNPNNDLVTIIVTSSSPVGGMDYDSGGLTFKNEMFRDNTSSSPKDIICLLKKVLSNDEFNFKKYGKPTKNFKWIGLGKGISIKLATEAINSVYRKDS